MFPDSLVFNLIVFALGQAAAIGYLRTGLVRRGVAILVATWLLADVVLVARFAFQSTGAGYVAALALLQIVSVSAFVLFVTGRIRRASKATRARRDALYREAFTAYLRDEVETAIGIYGQLCRADPWDLPVRVALATALDEQGAGPRARRHWIAARSLDADGGRYRDLFVARDLDAAKPTAKARPVTPSELTAEPVR